MYADLVGLRTYSSSGDSNIGPSLFKVDQISLLQVKSDTHNIFTHITALTIFDLQI